VRVGSGERRDAGAPVSRLLAKAPCSTLCCHHRISFELEHRLLQEQSQNEPLHGQKIGRDAVHQRFLPSSSAGSPAPNCTIDLETPQGRRSARCPNALNRRNSAAVRCEKGCAACFARRILNSGRSVLIPFLTQTYQKRQRSGRPAGSSANVACQWPTTNRTARRSVPTIF